MLQQIQTELKAPKSQFNKFGGYKYRSLEDITEAFKPLGEKYNCALIVDDEVLQIGDRYYVKATARLVDKAGKVIAESHGFAREAETKKGMDESQITGAASSYARKYACNGLFCIDDNKDADHETSHTPPARNGHNKPAVGSPPPAAGDLSPELDKEKQTLLEDVKEFYPHADHAAFAKTLASEPSRLNKIARIKWYLYFVADCKTAETEKKLEIASDYKGKGLTWDELAKASDGRVNVTYGQAKEMLFEHIRHLKGLVDEPAA